MDRRQEITDLAGGLDHGFIVLEALRCDKAPDYPLYERIIRRIKEAEKRIRKIEKSHTKKEIIEEDLLGDLFKKGGAK